MMRLLRVSLNTALRKNGEVTLRRLLFSCLYRFRRWLKTGDKLSFPFRNRQINKEEASARLCDAAPWAVRTGQNELHAFPEGSALSGRRGRRLCRLAACHGAEGGACCAFLPQYNFTRYT